MRATSIPAAGRGIPTDFAPVPRRGRRPRWLDWRILTGVLLVVTAVVLGSRIVGASSRTTPVLAATRDLAPGTVLLAADLTSVDVNIAAAADRYYAGNSPAAVGQVLTSWVHTGDLVPRSALAPAPDGRILPVSVSAARMPLGVTHGSRIDLYLLKGTGATATIDRLSESVTVQAVTSPSGGGLSGAAGDSYQLSLLLDQPAADRLIRALPTGEPMVLLASRV